MFSAAYNLFILYERKRGIKLWHKRDAPLGSAFGRV